MNMRLKMILATAAITATTALAGTAQASSLTHTEVTIKGTNGDYHGLVKSSVPDCANQRTVNVYEMLGSSPSPSTDQKIGSDTSELNGTKYEWSIGNSGYKHGSFYAKVKKTTECGSATSPVLDR
jgi:hypothetical protein